MAAAWRFCARTHYKFILSGRLYSDSRCTPLSTVHRSHFISSRGGGGLEICVTLLDLTRRRYDAARES
jgi:hypothetical protein